MALAGVVAAVAHTSADAAVIRVGPSRVLKTPSAAAARARNGDVVEIDAGVYSGDVAVWRRHRLTIRGVGGYAHLEAAGNAAEGKAIWVIKGRDTTVENIEFSGAAVSDRNGAGIRQEGAGLTVRHCYFHDNENGILGGAGNILIESSEFARNGYGDGRSHNIYIGERTRRFTLRFSYSHQARVGHNVKSRAAENYILYNRLMDEEAGNSSYIIDLPDGGIAYIIGNLVQQGRRASNHTLVSYAAEDAVRKARGLFVVNNSFVNDHDSGIFIDNHDPVVTAVVKNNIFVGAGASTRGRAEVETNLFARDPGFRDSAAYDYRLKQGSPAIDKGSDPGSGNGFDLTPRFEYVHAMRSKPRVRVGPIDIGAYEFAGGTGAGYGHGRRPLSEIFNNNIREIRTVRR